MEKLKTIQKRENLNEVYAADEKGNGGANHEYLIRTSLDGVIYDLADIQFQNGARKESGSIHGVIDTDLLEIVRHRLQCFQEGPFASRENALALTHIEEALMWLNKRVEDRQVVGSGPIKPSGKDMPVDARTRVKRYADIANIPNPHIGLKITVKSDETNNTKMTDYIVKSLKANSVGIANTLIDEVVRYADYLGVSSSSGGTSAGTGTGLHLNKHNNKLK